MKPVTFLLSEIVTIKTLISILYNFFKVDFSYAMFGKA